MRNLLVAASLAAATSAQAANRDHDADRVETVLVKSSPRFAVCFGKHDGTLPDRMKVIVQLRVSVAGRVASVIVEHGTPPRVAACVDSVLRSLSFGRMRRDFDVRVPIIFSR